MSKSPFRLALEEAINQRHSAVHPWSEAWTSGKLNRRLLGEWVKQHYHYVSHFSEWLGTVYANCPHWEVQHFLLENITEEEGFVGSAEFEPVRHSELLLDFAQTCGMSREEVIDAQTNGELLPETLGLQSWCHRQSMRPFVEALSGLLVGLESQVPAIYSKTTPPLIEKYGFTDDEVTFFSLHIVADQEHGDRGYEIVEKYATSEEQRQACVTIVKEAAMMRRLYLDGLYRKFLAQPDVQKL
ncbi:MAG TPA: iron-containing redox enzyme family protein, partial [Casimicrobiaceae bacterium]|nr:iron-containing redox enzyme family protein [Casimicrobiaceae bacterium]